MVKPTKIKVQVYGKTEVFPTRYAATKFFGEALKWCDPQSSEYGRYSYILQQLADGQTECYDLEPTKGGKNG